jgi:hypothetical protein
VPFDWREYLRLAGFLQAGVGPFDQEAAWRSAVSRAYYAALCRVRNFARDHQGFVPQGTADNHRGLRDHLRRQHQGRLAQQLGQLRQWRNACDDEEDVPNLQLTVGFSTVTAQDILNRF